jgi:hypothetical protein
MAFRIEHRIGIQAPASVIWDLIADLPRWSEWNPLYPRAAGRIGLGETLDLTLALPGEEPRQIAPKVMDWEPDAQVVWRLDLVPVLAHTVRYLEIEALSDVGCVFNNGEFFHGMLGERVGRSRRRAIHQGFTLLGEAVKRRSEDAWRGQRSLQATASA